MSTDLRRLTGRGPRVPFVRPTPMPENTTQALAWCQKHAATIRFWKDGDVTVSMGSKYALGDTLVVATCDLIKLLGQP